MRSQQDLVFVIAMIVVIGALIWTVSPLGKRQDRPELEIKASLSRD